MKKNLILIAGVLFLMTVSCVVDDRIQIETVINPEVKSTAKSSTVELPPLPVKSKDQVVIRFKTNPSLVYKRTLRNKFFVVDYNTCSCGDDNLELWTIDKDSINVEEVVQNLESSANVEGDYQLEFYLDQKETTIGSSNQHDYIALPGTSRTVNIAVIDTGVDYASFSKPFLYDSSGRGNCNAEISGWDFINEDQDVQDDAGHGTLVTKIITSELDKKNVDYRVLAVKAFDEKGKGTYWNLVCAMNYVINKQPAIDIVNMSFGWYIAPDEITLSKQDILKNMIDSRRRTVLFVASAGNASSEAEPQDVDNGMHLHFPSSYTSTNLLTVGGLKKTSTTYIDLETNAIYGIELAKKSNYGKLSIDMLAPFGGYFPVPAQEDDITEPQGTSFSCAYTTSRAVDFFKEGSNFPQDIKDDLFNAAYNANNLVGLTKEGKVILKE